MVIVSVLYPKSADSRFHHDYYMTKHMVMVRARWRSMGLSSETLLRGTSTLQSGPADYELIGLLAFDSLKQIQAALAARGAEIMGDIPNFTNVAPLIQLNDQVS